jgi:hypothetical protein
MLEEDLIDLFAEKKCIYCIYCPRKEDLIPCNYKGTCINKSGWTPTEDYKKELSEQITTYIEDAKQIIDYEKEMEIIHKAMQERLIIKHEKHRNSWKYTSPNYLRKRIKEIYKLLQECWDNNNINEQKRLIDLSNQSMLLYLRLINSKK